MKIRTSAPTRIDICGGTLDIWPLTHLVPNAVTVNVGVTLPAEVHVSLSGDQTFRLLSEDLNVALTGSYRSIVESKELPLYARLIEGLWGPDRPALSITTNATSPAGAGLGGSSALAIAFAKALIEARKTYCEEPDLNWDDHALVTAVQNIEAKLIWAPTGVQDYWGAVRGRVNLIDFPPEGVRVETLKPETVVGLEEQLILCFSGKSRASATNNWQVFKAAMEKNAEVLKILRRIGELASECAVAIRQGDLGTALLISKAEWEERKKLWKDISTPETDAIEQAAMESGAHFARVCGAGGGGVIAIFAPMDKKERVIEKLFAIGAVPLEGGVATEGLQHFIENS